MPGEISFEMNLRQWAQAMTEFEREQLPFATVMALTWTAKDVKAEHVRLLPLIFDRPTRYTMNSLQVTPAKKYRPIASVWFKDSARMRRHYLMPQVEGGTRPLKRFEEWLVRKSVMRSDEFAVPARGVKLDAFGNLSAGTIVQILSQLQAGPDAHQWETGRSRKRAGKRRTRYFVPQPPSTLKRGVWRQVGKRVEPVLIFVTSVRYEARYAFFDISRREAMAKMPINFQRALDRALRSARPAYSIAA
mgnify:CR=1 FL=1